MELQVEIITRETIKPSTPTPSHLRYHKLCLLDQLFILLYVPQVLFYRNNNNNSNTNQLSTSIPSVVQLIKESLAKTLSIFYPLAGRLTIDESIVDCNDKGISFVEARANCSLISFLEGPNRVKLVDQFIPKDIYDQRDRNIAGSSNSEPGLVTELIPVVIQVTIFECGGVAIGYQRFHKILDGNSWVIFLKNWAALATGRYKDVVTPDFGSATSIFPPRRWAAINPQSSLLRRPIPNRPLEENDCGYLVKAFAFTPDAILALQDKARSEHIPNPTRIEAVSGFIWKYAMTATACVGLSVPTALTHLVNLRSLINPPIPTAVGNLITYAIAHHDLLDIKAEPPALELPNLVAKIRKAVSEVKDAKFLSEFQGEGGANAIREYNLKVNDIYSNTNIKKYKFACWTRLGLDVDFGFGAPVWVGFIGGRISCRFSFIPLIATPDDGIEAWVPLDDKVMEVLLSDSEFLSFASPIN